MLQKKNNLRSRDTNITHHYYNNLNSVSFKEDNDKKYKTKRNKICNLCTQYLLPIGIITTFIVIIIVFSQLPSTYSTNNANNKNIKTNKSVRLREVTDWVSAFEPLIPSIKQPTECTLITDCSLYNGCNSVQYSKGSVDTDIIEWESMKYFENINHWRSLHTRQNTKLINMEGCPLVFVGGRIQRGWWNNLQITSGLHQHSVVYALKDDVIQDLGWRLFDIEHGRGWHSFQLCQPTNILLNIGSNDVINGESLHVILNEYHTLLYQIQQNVRSLSQPLLVSVIGLLPHTHNICDKIENNNDDKYNRWDANNEYFMINNAINQYLSYYVDTYNYWNQHVNINKNKMTLLYVDCNKYFLDDLKAETIKDYYENEYKVWTGNLIGKYMHQYFDLVEDGYRQLSLCFKENKAFDVSGFDGLIYGHKK